MEKIRDFYKNIPIEKCISVLSKITIYIAWFISSFVFFLVVHAKYWDFLFSEKTGAGRIERLDHPIPYCIGFVVASIWLTLRQFHSKINLFMTSIIFYGLGMYDAWSSATFSGVLLGFAGLAASAAQCTPFKTKNI